MPCPSCKASEGTSMSNRDSSLNPHRSFTAATSSSNRAVSMKSSKLAASFSFRNVWRNLANWHILWETEFMFFVYFFDPSEVRDRELILMVHSGSKRSMKCWHSLIAASSFFSQS